MNRSGANSHQLANPPARPGGSRSTSFVEQKERLGGLGLSKGHIYTNISPPTQNSSILTDQLNESVERTKPKITYPILNTLTIYKDAQLIQIKVDPIPFNVAEFDPTESQLRATRGRVTEWSRKARARFKRKISKVVQANLGNAICLTLTYPNEFPQVDDFTTYKGHLARLKRVLISLGFCGFWKLEFQKRGAAHFHLLLIPNKKIEGGLKQLRETISHKWANIVDSGDEKHIQAGITLDPVRSPRGAVGYLASYMGKKEQTMPGNFTGHYTGVVDSGKIPWGEEVVLPCGRKTAVTIRRILRNLVRKSMDRYGKQCLLKRLNKEQFSKSDQAKMEDLEQALFYPQSRKAKRIIEYIDECRWYRRPYKWRLRNSQTVNYIGDANKIAECLSMLLRSEKRSLRNHGTLP